MALTGQRGRETTLLGVRRHQTVQPGPQRSDVEPTSRQFIVVSRSDARMGETVLSLADVPASLLRPA